MINGHIHEICEKAYPLHFYAQWFKVVLSALDYGVIPCWYVEGDGDSLGSSD